MLFTARRSERWRKRRVAGWGEDQIWEDFKTGSDGSVGWKGEIDTLMTHLIHSVL